MSGPVRSEPDPRTSPSALRFADVASFDLWADRQEEPFELIDGLAVPKNRLPPIAASEAEQVANRKHQILATRLATLLEVAFVAAGAPHLAVVELPIDVTPPPGAGPRRRIPDVVVLTGASRAEAETPLLVAEIESPTTEMTQHRQKLLDYMRTSSIVESLDLAVADRMVSVRRRRGDLLIEEEILRSPGETLTLRSLGVSIAMADLYRDLTGTEA